VEYFLMRIFDNVLHPHNPFSIKIAVLYVFIQECPDHMLCCLIAIVFDEVIHDKLVHIEEMSVLAYTYDSVSMIELSKMSTTSHWEFMTALMNWLLLTMLSVVLDYRCRAAKDSFKSI
jgi:AraC-like DNA-binding protein